ncbi:MAG: hypothetical protein Q9227_003716 [Pyrenula ochraceoflavens]
METRFNSFYREDMHPFPRAMTRFLLSAGRKSILPSMITKFMWSENKQYEEDMALMQKTAMDIVQDRRAHPTTKKSLLNAMLNGKDPKTGQKMSEQSIAYNMVTFLVAGHETTAGFLSYIFYYLCTKPEVQLKAQQEIDEVIGDGPVHYSHMSKLPYITAIMREAIRLHPPAPAPSRGPRKGTYGDTFTMHGGDYIVPKDTIIRCLMAKIHRDPSVWGADAADFNPEHCVEENFKKIPKNAWHPFGMGERACIGRPFAWLESTLAIALLLQNFSFQLADPSYTLRTKQTLTVKPTGFFMKASLRDGITVQTIEQRLAGASHPTATNGVPKEIEVSNGKSSQKPMTILWAGNSGTCESLAQALGKNAGAHGYKAETKCLDDAVNSLLRDRPIVVITSSYEGEPPDNARHFVHYLETLKEKSLEGVSYAVFGCGNHEWQATYQKIPKLCDAMMEERGASRLSDRGLADAAEGDLFTDFEKWEEHTLWPALQKKYGESENTIDEFHLEADIMTDARASHLKQPVCSARVLSNSQIESAASQRWHITVKLPSNMTYRAGDYLAVLPLNHDHTIHRVMNHFHLPYDAMISIHPSDTTTLPTDSPIPVYELLRSYVELNQPATYKQVRKLSSLATDAAEKSSLEALLHDPAKFSAEITSKHQSALDLLEKHSSIHLLFPSYLTMLPQLRLRQYSISSSPLSDPTICTLTYNVLDTAHLSGDGRFLGAGSNYLASLRPGDTLHVAVKESHSAFHLPLDIEKTPIIMVAAGTGIAPFRGFIQERACQMRAGRKNLAPAVLYFGTQTPEQVPHREELRDWEEAGAVATRLACSRAEKESKGAKYVQERLEVEKEELKELFRKGGAKVYICGSGRVAEGVRELCVRLRMERLKEEGRACGKEEAEEWYKEMRNERFMSDVFD